MPFAFHYAARSDVGMVRSNNEDSGVRRSPPAGHGRRHGRPRRRRRRELDGHRRARASSTARRSAAATSATPCSTASTRANAEIGDQVHADPSLDGMGTTLIALLRARDKIVLAHIGDSRAFMVRDGVRHPDHQGPLVRPEPRRRGADHRRRGQTHPQRSLVTRVLTGAHDDEPDLVVRQGRIGDRYLIASDGLTDYVARDTIDEVLTTTADPGECADQLVALALRAGAPDNVTVVVGDLVDMDRSRHPAHPAAGRGRRCGPPDAARAPSPRRPPPRPPPSLGRPRAATTSPTG